VGLASWFVACAASAAPPVQDWAVASPTGLRLGSSAVPSSEPRNQRVLAVDADGNSYVAGASHNGSNRDYLTQKFDADGVLLWSATYDGPANGNDYVYALVLDGQGNVLVTGTSNGGATSFDIATLKYSGATGAPMWSGGAIVDGAARYDGPASLADGGVAIAVDGNGDVVVTGNTLAGLNDQDFATIKYSGATGAPMWSGGAIVNGAARYYGEFNLNDLAQAVAVDADGDVVVIGSVLGAGDYNFATVKYSGATGATVWPDVGGTSPIVNGGVRYDNRDSSGRDLAVALAIDAAGDVFVTGSSIGSSESTLTPFDVATLKYSGATGQPMWSDPSTRFGAARYDDFANADDRATSMALDANGDVVVTGYIVGNGVHPILTLKYSGTTGAQIWAAPQYGSPSRTFLEVSSQAVALDANGDVVVAGWRRDPFSPSTANFVALKYAGATGAEAWEHRYDAGTAGDDQAYALAAAPDGSLRIAGNGATPQGERIVLLKLRAANDDPALLSLILAGHSFAPAFDPGVTAYASTVGAAPDLQVTATAQDVHASVAIGGQGAETGASTRTVPLAYGANAIPIVVTAEDAVAARGYTLAAYRAAIALDPGSLAQVHDGSGRVATATTQPSGLAHAMSYVGIDGTAYGPSATPPIHAGRYAVTATLTETNYSGAANGTLVVDRAAQAALTASATPTRVALGGTSTLGTQGGSGSGAVTFEVTAGASRCSLAEGTLTGTDLGVCTVTATKAGDVDFEAATADIEVTVVPPGIFTNFLSESTRDHLTRWGEAATRPLVRRRRRPDPRRFR
jgi:hypothetical protein